MLIELGEFGEAKLWADELGQPNSGSGQPQIDDLWRDFGDPWKGVREHDGRNRR